MQAYVNSKAIEANRLNARKSTGPGTPAGKAASRMNAFNTGIDADSQVIRGESAADLAALTAEYYDRDQPSETQAPLGEAFSSNSQAFSRLQRRIDSADRNFHRALKELRLQLPAAPDLASE